MLFWSNDFRKMSKKLKCLKKYRICGVDPGVRNFMTTYDTLGKISYYNYNSRYHNALSSKKYHYKVAKTLIENYDIIMYGDIMINHKTLRFDLFKKTLIRVAKQSKTCKVYVVDESFTTKTCSKCGELNMDLTTEKEYKCIGCKQLVYRDSNAAKNILLKGLISNRDDVEFGWI